MVNGDRAESESWSWAQAVQCRLMVLVSPGGYMSLYRTRRRKNREEDSDESFV